MKGTSKNTATRKKAVSKKTAKTTRKIQGAAAATPADMKLSLTEGNRKKFVATCEGLNLGPIKAFNGVISGFNKAVAQ